MDDFSLCFQIVFRSLEKELVWFSDWENSVKHHDAEGINYNNKNKLYLEEWRTQACLDIWNN